MIWCHIIFFSGFLFVNLISSFEDGLKLVKLRGEAMQVRTRFDNSSRINFSAFLFSGIYSFLLEASIDHQWICCASF